MRGRIARDSLRLAAVIAVAIPAACSLRAEFSASLECDGTRCKLSSSARIFTPEETSSIKPGPGDLELPAALLRAKKIEPGAILVSEDFIRRVRTVSVDGELAHAETEPATLAEVVEHGESATPSEGIDLAADPDVRASWAALNPKAEWTSGGRFQYRNTSEFVSPSGAHFSLDYELSLRPSVDAGLRFGWFSLQHAHAIVRADMRARLDVVGSFVLETNKVYRVELWRSPEFKVALPPIGPVPVTFRSQLVLTGLVTVDAKGKVVVRTGFDLMATGAYGFNYESDRGLQPVKVWNTDGSTITPPSMTTSTSVTVRGAVRAELDAGIFGGAWPLTAGGGLRIYAEPYAEFTATPSNWQARAALNGGVDAYLDVLGFTVAEKSYPLFARADEPVLGTWPSSPGTSPVVTPCSTASMTTDLKITCGAYAGCSRLCAIAENCLKADDCLTGRCAGGQCADTKPTVVIGGACSADLDCIEGVCTSEPDGAGKPARFCRPLHCSNESATPQEENVGETGIDCGGPSSGCRRCGLYSHCLTDNDCRQELRCRKLLFGSFCTR